MAPFKSSIIVSLLIPLCAAAVSLQETYTAGVVDYHPKGSKGDTANFILNANVAEYEKIIGEAKQQGVDIVVFPEYGLTGVAASNKRDLAVQFAQTVPSPPKLGETAEVPCLSPNSSVAIKRLSCSAREKRIYVVVNLLEIVPKSLSDQPSSSSMDGFYIYNANVAFDRDGAVVSKYHKYNLFLEPSVDKPKYPQYSTFDTDFGVTYGMFICFDILFGEPAYTLVKHMNVKNMIYSTAWGSQIPFLTAVQTQQSWSFGLDVNLLASGYSYPDSGHGGSGIYLGRTGKRISTMPTTERSTLLMAEIPLISLHEHIPRGEVKSISLSDTELEAQGNYSARAKHMFLIHDDLSNYTSSDVLINGRNNIRLCHKNLCCNFQADLQFNNESNESPKYRFVISDSEIKYASTYNAKIQVCGLIYCKGDDVKGCVYYPDDPETLDHVNFQSIIITGNFSSPKMIFPNSLTTSLEPLYPSSRNLIENDSQITFEYNLDVKGLLTFSLYSRILEDSIMDNEIPFD